MIADRATTGIRGYHAHVYYDPATRDQAADLRASVASRFDVELGRWRDQPVGPHPSASYQIAFRPEQFGEIVPWLALNRGKLVVFIHPDTGDPRPDHAEHAIWLGAFMDLDLDVL